jgi:hypothetical protein
MVRRVDENPVQPKPPRTKGVSKAEVQSAKTNELNTPDQMAAAV